MDAERWRQIEEGYHGVLECRASERDAFLDKACKDNVDLRKEVEELVRFGDSPAGELLGHSPWESREEQTRSLASGTRLGPYEIVGPIAAGGMGQVFRAIDTRLGRSIAIKTSRTQ